jgi:signal transduction histidine kinase
MSTSEPGSAAVAPERGPTILVVDDELGPRESLKLILTPTYEVITANDGREGVAKFEATKPDMVISDIRMPGLTGIDLMKAVKERSPETPFVLITGYGTLESAQEAVRVGAFDYISKPYNVEEIRRVAAKALAEVSKRRELHKTVQRLQTMNTQLEQQIQELDQKATIGDLSAEMIHDLNNPITVLRGYIALLEDSLGRKTAQPVNEEKEFLAVIKEQIERCVRLTRKFLDYARNQRQTWDRENINDMVQDTLFVLRVRMRQTHIDLKTDFNPLLPQTWVQPTPLQQVFYNLISNAIDAIEAAGKGGQIVITTSVCQDTPEAGPPRDYVEVAIADTGPGIPADVQAKLFTPFFTTKPKGKGTGLGLSICRRVADEHQGRIILESAVGKGTCFRVRVPICTEKPEASSGTKSP